MEERELTPDQMEQMQVMMSAFHIYLNRDTIRGDMWRTRPPSHKLDMIDEKTERARRAIVLLAQQPTVFASEEEYSPEAAHRADIVREINDCCWDIINFAVFAIREVREGNIG
jgi:hypothetical protein